METALNNYSKAEMVFMAVDDVLATVNNSVKGLLEINKVGEAFSVAVKGNQTNQTYKVNMLSFPKLTHKIINAAAQTNKTLKEAVLENPASVQPKIDQLLANTPPLSERHNQLSEMNILITACGKDSPLRSKENLDKLDTSIDKLFGGNPEFIMKLSEFMLNKNGESIDYGKILQNATELRDKKENFGYEILSPKGSGNVPISAMEELERKRLVQIKAAGSGQLHNSENGAENKELVFGSNQNR
jgi:hypothetical protein